MPLTMPRSEYWLDDAPCAGRWPEFDALPLLDPSLRIRNDAFILASLPALETCATCPFTRECLQRVDPARNYHDGVCAGRLWRNGRVIYTPRRAAA